MSTLCILISSISAQVNHFDLLGDKNQIEIPIKYTSGFVIIEVTINDTEPINLLLDTGAENLILFDFYKSLKMGLELDKEVKIKGSDIQGDAIAYVSRANNLALPETKQLKTDIIILKQNNFQLTNLIGIPIEGIIGGRTFWNLVLKIDYIKGVLSLTKKDKFVPPHYYDDKYQEIDIEIKNHKPYIYNSVHLSESEEVATKTLIDSGAAIGYMMLLNTSEKLRLPEKYINGNLGKGIGGDIKGYIGKVHALNITDRHRFKQLVSYYQNLSDDIDSKIYNNRNAIIGNPVLSKFDVVIDYVDSKLYLKPNRRYKKKFRIDKSGLVIYAVGENLDQFVIKDTYEGSPAEEIGLQPNDLIKRIGLRTAVFLNMDVISRIFQRKEGRKVKVIIERKGKKIAKTLILRDYLAF